MNDLEHRELTETELHAVSGGAGKHFDNVELTSGDGGSAPAPTPASAWNACLNGYGFPSMA
jgi:hypothetical protein